MFWIVYIREPGTCTMAKIKRKAPDALIILSTLLVLFVMLTWIIPAGEFERVVKDGREVVVAGTYHRVDANPLGFWDVFRAPLKGIVSAADIIGFVLLVGGAFSILTATGALDAGLQQILRFSQKNPQFKHAIIPLLMVIFSLAGATFGMSEEVLVFIMITIPMARKMGYDTIVGVAIPFVGAGMGFAAAPFNPFTVGIAQGIAEIPLFSGFEYRLLAWLIYTLLGIGFVMRYALKLEKNFAMSPLGNSTAEFEHDTAHDLVFTGRRKVIVLLFIASLVGIMLGALQFDWYIIELSGLFLLLGLVSAVLARMSAEQTVKAFTQGTKDLLMAALLIGFSKAILVIASDGKIIDTILHGMSTQVAELSPAISAGIMFGVQGLINFFIPSGSGQAAITMPIMTPLADLLGLSRQTAVLAYQFGDGLFNLIIPTSGITMGILSVAKIPYPVWLRWMAWFMVVMVIVSLILLAIPAMGWIDW
jgi:uncharacterized ion transporter superfamily protein YfcC